MMGRFVPEHEWEEDACVCDSPFGIEGEQEDLRRDMEWDYEYRDGEWEYYEDTRWDYDYEPYDW